MIVVDTHVLLWWISDAVRLSRPAARVLAKQAGHGEILVSSITTWELARLVADGRLALSMPLDLWLGKVQNIATLRFIPVDNPIALESVHLPSPFHKDPADRMIVATARRFGVPVVTADEKIRRYPHVESVW